MTTQAASLIEATQNRIGAAGGQHIGDLTTWNASGVDMDREIVRAIFEAEGFGHLAPSIEPARALTRAGYEVPRASGILVRPFARPRKDSPVALGFYVQEARDGETGDGYTCGARARLVSIAQNGAVVVSAVALPPENACHIESAMTHAEACAQRANHLMKNAETNDVSHALITAVKELGGVPLRDRGGFYLVPVSNCERWRRFLGRFSAHGIEPVAIEMHDAPTNVAAVASAAKGSLESEISGLAEDLEKATAEGMKIPSLERRVALCDELTAKAELYRNVLQDAATDIGKRLAALRAGFERELVDSDDADPFTLSSNEAAVA